jgi:quercetin dioxygenase-like cupin family protein
VKKDKVICSLPKPHVDERGSIQKLVGFPVGSVHVITSRKGSVRANHYHKRDDHHCYLVSGGLDYYDRPAGSARKPRKVRIRPGQMFYSPPGVEHAMKFTKDSVFFVFAKLRRRQAEYEDDLVRVKVIRG